LDGSEVVDHGKELVFVLARLEQANRVVVFYKAQIQLVNVLDVFEALELNFANVAHSGILSRLADLIWVGSGSETC